MLTGSSGFQASAAGAEAAGVDAAGAEAAGLLAAGAAGSLPQAARDKAIKAAIVKDRILFFMTKFPFV